MTITINRSNYIDLLNQVQIVPKVIETELEYDLFLSVTEGLLAKRENRTPEETALFMLLVKLVEDYEREFHSLSEWTQVSPHKFLQHMMEAREMTETDLANLLNISPALAALIIAGDLSIDRSQSQTLGDYFKVAPTNFHNHQS
jgi:HTH-type transcriptional regulator / antitoxin HigA